MSRRIALIAAAVVAALSLSAPAHAAPPASVGVGAVSVSAATTPAAAVLSSTYRIVSGDTLGGIAARFCGSSSKYPALAAGNGIANANLIYAGRVIRLTCTASAPARVVSVATGSSRAQQVVAYVLAQLGKPYVFGAAGPWSFDCSGLSMAAYARVGVKLPHYAENQVYYGRYVPESQLQPGDLIWPKADHDHVVVYVGGGYIVEAPRPGLRVEKVRLYGYSTARRLV